MIVIPDAGDIKARITIEYDGSGVQQAKEDLASLADISGGFEQAAQDIGGNLSGLSDQFVTGVAASEGFSKTIEALQKPLGSGGMAITQLSDSLSKGQDALSGTGAAFEALQEPLGATVTMLQSAPEPIAQIAQNAETLQKPLASVADNFATFQDTLTQSVPLLPQFADSLHEVGAAFDPKAFGLDQFQENMSVFQDALVNPEPFSMIQQHLNETGQTWDDFSSAIGDNNAAYLKEMAANADVTHEVLGNMQKDFTSTEKTIDWSAVGPPTDWTKGVGTAAESMATLGAAAKDASQMMPMYGWSPAPTNTGVMHGPFPEGQQFAFTAPGEGGLNMSDLWMPMMGAQMAIMAIQGIGQAIGQFIQSVYQGATLAEGPIAHSAGTFTGTMDALAQTLEFSNMRFSESFGQQMIPMISVATNLLSNGPDLGGNFGKFVNDLLIGTLPPGLSEMMLQAELQSNAPSPLSPAQRYTMTQLSQMPQTVDMSAAQMNIQADQAMAEALSPDYLAAAQKSATAQRILQQAQLRYNSLNPPESPQMLLSDYQFAQYASSQGYTPDQIDQMNRDWQAAQAMSPLPYEASHKQAPLALAPDTSFDITDIAGAFYGGGVLGPSTGVSSFLANMYRNIFGGIGGGFDAYLSGDWLKSIIPPGTSINTGDIFGGIGQTFSNLWSNLQKFFAQPSDMSGAGGVGVGVSFGVGSNLGTQIADMVANIQLPHVDLSGMASSLAGMFSGIQLPHLDLSGFTSGLGNLFSGIQLPHIDLSGFTSGIASAFSNIQLPQINFSSLMDIGSNLTSQLSNLFSGIHLPSIPDIAGDLNSMLGNVFGGIHLPSLPDIAGDINSMIGNIFGGIHLPSLPDIAGDINTILGNMFSGIHIPSLPDIAGSINSMLSGMFSGISSMLSMPGIPLYARGVQSAPPGLAVVGDAGPELLMMAGGESVYPMSSLSSDSFPSIFGESGGNISLTIDLTATLDGLVVARQTIPYIAPILRQMTGRRQ